MERDDDLSTRLAEDRTVLANERTYAAWIRTGIAALASGIAFKSVLSDDKIGWAIDIISIILLVFSLCAFVIGIWHYTHLGMRLRRAEIRTLPIKTLIFLTALLCATSVTALVGLFLA
jgi:putative membrane protein